MGGTGAWPPGSWAFSSWRPGPSRWRLARRPPLSRAGPLSRGYASSGPAEAGTFRLSRPDPQVLGEGLDEERHARMMHSLVGWPTLEPALEAVLEFRWDVLRELHKMVEDAADDTALPAHVRATYVTKDRPRPFQGLVFDRLLRGVGYPAADDLQQDVNVGSGAGSPGTRWRPRSDERYARPEKLDSLRRENPLGEESRQAQGPGAHQGAPRRTGGGNPLDSIHRPLRRRRPALGRGHGGPSPAAW